MKHVLSVIGATLALSNAALAQSSTPAGKPIPPMPQWYDDAKACRWEWLEGRDMGLWAQRCNVTGAIWHLVYDPEADGFVLHVEKRR